MSCTAFQAGFKTAVQQGCFSENQPQASLGRWMGQQGSRAVGQGVFSGT